MHRKCRVMRRIFKKCSNDIQHTFHMLRNQQTFFSRPHPVDEMLLSDGPYGIENHSFSSASGMTSPSLLPMISAAPTMSETMTGVAATKRFRHDLPGTVHRWQVDGEIDGGIQFFHLWDELQVDHIGKVRQHFGNPAMTSTESVSVAWAKHPSRRGSPFLYANWKRTGTVACRR